MKIKINFKKMKGFTLIELIVVIAIIGILTAVLVPSLTGYVNKARRRTDAANAKELYNELSLLLLDDTLYEGFNGKEETALRPLRSAPAIPLIVLNRFLHLKVVNGHL